jgi:hypothetical protein
MLCCAPMHPFPVACVALASSLLALGCGGAIVAIEAGDASTDSPGDASTDSPGDAVARLGMDVEAETQAAPEDDSSASCPIPSSDPSPHATDDLTNSCDEGINTDSDIDDNCGGSSTAWEYVPRHDIELTRLELNDTGGGVALFDSDCDKPGVKLFEGSVPSGGPRSWRGADVSPSIHLTAGHRYFIEQITPEEGDVCSVAKSGTPQRQFNPPGFCGSGWGGPYIWLAWTAHVIGSCP